MVRFLFNRLVSALLILIVSISALTACSNNLSGEKVNISSNKSGNDATPDFSGQEKETNSSSKKSIPLQANTKVYNRTTSEIVNESAKKKITNATSNAESTPKNIIIGVEYASPGMAATYSQLGVSGVKYYPDEFKWGSMQCGKCSKINFKAMDKFVTEYQNAGFSDIVLSLKPVSNWASVNAVTDFSPKPKYMGLFEDWVKAIVERYDMDGSADMAGLKFPINIVEIGIEFSSYEPESADSYINMLEHAYKAAHSVSQTVKVLHSAFLVSTAFISNPGPENYDEAFAAVDKRIMVHSLSDMRKILDRPDIFDMANFHALCYPAEIKDTVTWLKYEMSQRNYSKPIVISDTAVNPFLGYGSALVTNGTPSQLAILSPPAKDEDRERLKAYFTNLINSDKDSIKWVHAFCASDMVKKVMISAEQGVTAINTAFMEEFAPSKSRMFGAAAGNSIWSGMTLTSVKAFSNERKIEEIRPSFYAIKQLSSHIKGYTTIEKISAADNDIQIYKVTKNEKIFYLAWYEPEYLVLPGDTVPSKNAVFSGLGANFTVENIISDEGQTVPVASIHSSANGTASVNLTYLPCYVIPG